MKKNLKFPAVDDVLISLDTMEPMRVTEIETVEIAGTNPVEYRNIINLVGITYSENNFGGYRNFSVSAEYWPKYYVAEQPPAPGIGSFALTGKEVLLHKKTNSVCKIDSINEESSIFTWSGVDSEIQGICPFESFEKEFDVLSEKASPSTEERLVIGDEIIDKNGKKAIIVECGAGGPEYGENEEWFRYYYNHIPRVKFQDPMKGWMNRFAVTKRMANESNGIQTSPAPGVDPANRHSPLDEIIPTQRKLNSLQYGEDFIDSERKKLIGKRINVAGNVAFATAVRDKLDSLRFQRSQQFVHSFDPDWISIINDRYYVSEHVANCIEISVWDVITREEFMISNGQVTEDYMAKPVENQEQTKIALNGIHGYNPESNVYGPGSKTEAWSENCEKWALSAKETIQQQAVREYFASLGVPDGIVPGDEVVAHLGNEIESREFYFVGVHNRAFVLCPVKRNTGGVFSFVGQITASRPGKQPAEKSAREEAIDIFEKHWRSEYGKEPSQPVRQRSAYIIDAIEEALTKNQK